MWRFRILLCAIVVGAGPSCGRRADMVAAEADASGSVAAEEDIPAGIGDVASELPLPVTLDAGDDAGDAEVQPDTAILADGQDSPDAPALDDTSGSDAPEPDLPPCQPELPTGVSLPECATATDCPEVADQQAECIYGSCNYVLETCSTAGKPPLCDDGHPCTADVCVAGDSPTGGVCLYVCVAECCASNFDCEDGNPCTIDFCVQGSCSECVHVPSSGLCCMSNVDCDDGEPCTVDKCDFSALTCQHTATCCAP